MRAETRFLIRPLKNKDAEGMLEWMTDLEITKFFRFDASSVTLDSCRSFIAGADQNGNTLHYAVVDERDEYLGTISLKNIDEKASSAEYAISMRACAHGSGAAADGTEAVLNIAFNTLGLHRVYLNVLADNGRANAFYRKMEFSFEYSEKNAVQINGIYRDLNWYAVTKP